MSSPRITLTLHTTTALIAALLFAGTARAEDNRGDIQAELTRLRARVDAQDQEIASLKDQKGQKWLDQKRAEEVKDLVRGVLADADTRASLLDHAVNAGYERGFYIATEDGNNLLRINVVSQTRYIYASRDDNFSQEIRTAIPGSTPGAPAVTRVTTIDSDQSEAGFQQRRLEINFQGHMYDPRLTYRVRIAADAEGGTMRTDWAWIGYQLTDQVNLVVGQLTPDFLREENVGSPNQLAAERSYTADYFTTDYSQGIQARYWNDRVSLVATIHDGSYGWRTEFDNDRTNLAIAGRAEYVLAGDPKLYQQKGWRQLNDFTSWSGDQPAILIGAAIDYELGESGGSISQTNPATLVTAGVYPDILKFTADISGEFGGWNVFAAFIGQQIQDNGETAISSGFDTVRDAQQYGVVAQAGYMVIPDKLEPFVRFEWLEFDGLYFRNDGGGVQTNVIGSAPASSTVPADKLRILTVGANYYLYKQNAKLTFDAMYLFDGVPAANRGQGILVSPDGGQIVVRGQFSFGF